MRIMIAGVTTARGQDTVAVCFRRNAWRTRHCCEQRQEKEKALKGSVTAGARDNTQKQQERCYGDLGQMQGAYTWYSRCRRGHATTHYLFIQAMPKAGMSCEL